MDNQPFRPSDSVVGTHSTAVQRFSICNQSRQAGCWSPFFASFVLAVNAVPVKPAPEIGNVFAVYPGWDMLSPPESNSPIANQSERQCLEACHTSSTWIAYAYGPYGDPFTGPGSCYLKDTIVLSDFFQQPFDVSAGLLGPCGTFSPGQLSCIVSAAFIVWE
ncbi:hypothetical protein K438DRAFT_1762556 [Mycena galopus ATCC 62051]|nr:hypothetical protein K438DRAFT_1762556 [Mycena galopus ATCC 62051]